MKTLYALFIQLMIFGMKVGARFNQKIRKGVEGRKESCQRVREKINPDDKVIWMHAASLGEYDQGFPVLSELKKHFPQHKFLITFFSPSGYENRVHKDQLADVICYLPFDREKDIRAFIFNFKTDIFITVKYEYWYNLLRELKKNNVRSYVISALFYEKQIFFKPYGKWFVKSLRNTIDWFFHQTNESTVLAKGIKLLQSSISGDTRFDMVKNNKHRDNFVPYISQFVGEQTTIVFGSSWCAEEKIAEVLTAHNTQVKIIIAPHEISRIAEVKDTFSTALLYSELNDSSDFTSSILIIDTIGLLSKLYAYADLAVVGGGFHSSGLHNILEAAVFGIPVIFGNHYKKNPEADGLIAINGGKSFDEELYAATYLLELLKNPELMQSMGENAGEFVHDQPNATQTIMNKLLNWENPSA